MKERCEAVCTPLSALFRTINGKGTYNGLKPYPLVILVLSSSSALIGISDPLCLSCNPIGQGIDGSLVQKRGCQAHSLVNQDDVSKLTIDISYISTRRR